MFQYFPPLAKNRNSSSERDIILEPHVWNYDFSPLHARKLAQPWQIMGVLGIFCLLVGLWSAFIRGDMVTMEVALSLMAVMGGFALAGQFSIEWKVRMEKEAEIEVDFRDELILYQNQNRKVLFHISQIEHCEIRNHLMFPYQLQELHISLAGGDELCVSSLLMNPEEFTATFGIPYEYREIL